MRYLTSHKLSHSHNKNALEIFLFNFSIRNVRRLSHVPGLLSILTCMALIFNVLVPVSSGVI
uniref:Uncharacterized protein n=1 Tax=Castor canadensis TaxID=51338 RepID=A0A8C0X6F5_CASCN